jgi:hypothetical protein
MMIDQLRREGQHGEPCVVCQRTDGFMIFYRFVAATGQPYICEECFVKALTREKDGVNDDCK